MTRMDGSFESCGRQMREDPSQKRVAGHVWVHDFASVKQAARAAGAQACKTNPTRLICGGTTADAGWLVGSEGK
jgi:hypothetical protein